MHFLNLYLYLFWRIFLGSRSGDWLITLTGIVGVTHGDHAPRELGLEISQGRGTIEIEGAGDRAVLGEHGVVESGTGVVAVHKEVIVLRVAGACGLEVEFLGRGGDGVGHDRGGHQSKSCEDLHFGVDCDMR